MISKAIYEDCRRRKKNLSIAWIYYYYYYYYYCHPNANEILKYTFKERTMHQTIQINSHCWEIQDSPSIVTEGSYIVEC
jgi:hypothetical protein